MIGRFFLESLILDTNPEIDNVPAPRKPLASILPEHLTRADTPLVTTSAAGVVSKAVTASEAACSMTVDGANQYYALSASGVPLTPYKRGAAFFHGPAGLWGEHSSHDTSLDKQYVEVQRAFPGYHWERNHSTTVLDENMVPTLVGDAQNPSMGYLNDPEIHTLYIATHSMVGFGGGIQVAAYTRQGWKNGGRQQLKQLKDTYGRKFVTSQKAHSRKGKKSIAAWLIIVHPGALFTTPPTATKDTPATELPLFPDEKRGILGLGYCYAGEFFGAKDYSSTFHLIAGGSDDGVSSTGLADFRRLVHFSTNWTSYPAVVNRENRYFSRVWDQWSRKAKFRSTGAGITNFAKEAEKANTNPGGTQLISWRVLRPETKIPDMESYPTVKSIGPTSTNIVGDFGTNGAKISNGTRVSFSSLVEAIGVIVNPLDAGQAPMSMGDKIVVNVPTACGGDVAKAEWVKTYCINDPVSGSSHTSGWQLDIRDVSLIQLPAPKGAELCQSNPGFANAKAQIDVHKQDLLEHEHYVTITIPGGEGSPLKAPNGIRFEGNDNGDYAVDDYGAETVFINKNDPNASCLVQRWKYTTVPTPDSPVSGSGFRIHIPCTDACSAAAVAPTPSNSLDTSPTLLSKSVLGPENPAEICLPPLTPILEGPVVDFSGAHVLPIIHRPLLVTTADRGYFVAEDNVSLWRTDATLAGTQAIPQAGPPPSGPGPADLTALGTTLFFTSGRDLHRIDATMNLSEIVQLPVGVSPPSPSDSLHDRPGSLKVVSNGSESELYFRYGRWHVPLPGIPATTGKVIAKIGATGPVSIVLNPAVHQTSSLGGFGVLFDATTLAPTLIFEGGCATGFPCNDKARDVPWIFDNTQEEVTVEPIAPPEGPLFASDDSVVSMSSHVFFIGNTNGIEALWYSAGPSPAGEMPLLQVVKDTEGMDLQFSRNQQNKLFAHDSSTLYVVDISSLSIRRISIADPSTSTEIFASSNGSVPNQLTLVNNQLFFTEGGNVHVYDGSVVTLLDTLPRDPRDLIEVGGRVFFVVSAVGGIADQNDDELWVIEGSTVRPVRTQWSDYEKGDISHLARIGTTLVFFMREHVGEKPWELWRLPM